MFLRPPPGVLLTQNSDWNAVTNNQVSGLFGYGIEVNRGSGLDFIEGSTVATASPPGYYELLDENP
jgi:hypothetical protein